MKKYFYFRDVTDEIDDDAASASIVVPVENITGIGPGSITTLNVFFKNAKNDPSNDYVTLTVTRGRLKEVMQELVSAMNSGPHSDGFVVVADDVTTTTGSTSIQGDDKAVTASYISKYISACEITTS